MRRVFATVCLAAVFAVPLPALADTGMAYDSVNRIVMNADPSAMQPGPFDQDFAAASATPSPAGGGGLFGHLKQQIAMAANAGQMMSTGIAQRHYVAGSKSRTDMVSLGVATITDCAARTITTLNLRDKTYRIESMDHPSTGRCASRATPP
jgi:hypothetical protein